MSHASDERQAHPYAANPRGPWPSTTASACIGVRSQTAARRITDGVTTEAVRSHAYPTSFCRHLLIQRIGRSNPAIRSYWPGLTYVPAFGAACSSRVYSYLRWPPRSSSHRNILQHLQAANSSRACLLYVGPTFQSISSSKLVLPRYAGATNR